MKGIVAYMRESSFSDLWMRMGCIVEVKIVGEFRRPIQGSSTLTDKCRIYSSRLVGDLSQAEMVG